MRPSIGDIYFDPKNPHSFSSFNDVYQGIREKRPNISKEKVRDFLAKQDTFTLHKQPRGKFKTRKTLAKGVNYLWQGDLISKINLSRYNRSYKYILVIIDVLSRFAYTRPLRNKTGKTVSEAFESIIAESGNKPKKLQTDRGKEFYNSNFQAVCKRHNIIHYSSFSDQKASLCERLIRTLSSRLHKYMTSKNTLNYVDVLQSVTDAYNNRKHRAHKMQPSKVTKRNEKKVWAILYRDYMNSDPGRPVYKVGDLVRLVKLKAPFTKGYNKNFTDEIFTIDRVKRTRPITYQVSDKDKQPIDGSFYKEELVRVLL